MHKQRNYIPIVMISISFSVELPREVIYRISDFASFTKYYIFNKEYNKLCNNKTCDDLIKYLQNSISHRIILKLILNRVQLGQYPNPALHKDNLKLFQIEILFKKHKKKLRLCIGDAERAASELEGFKPIAIRLRPSPIHHQYGSTSAYQFDLFGKLKDIVCNWICGYTV